MLTGPQELREGECYFEIFFHEEDDRYPCVETYVFVGSKTRPRRSWDREPRPLSSLQDWYFQDVESYLKHGNVLKRSPSRWPKRHGLVIIAADAVEGMFDLRGLAEALGRLGRERRSTAPSDRWRERRSRPSMETASAGWPSPRDPRSSAAWFTGWGGTVTAPGSASPVVAARTWLVRVGWRRHGLVDIDEGPRGDGARRRIR